MDKCAWAEIKWIPRLSEDSLFTLSRVFENDLDAAMRRGKIPAYSGTQVRAAALILIERCIGEWQKLVETANHPLMQEELQILLQKTYENTLKYGITNHTRIMRKFEKAIFSEWFSLQLRPRARIHFESQLEQRFRVPGGSTGEVDPEEARREARKMIKNVERKAIDEMATEPTRSKRSLLKAAREIFEYYFAGCIGRHFPETASARELQIADEYLSGKPDNHR